MLRPHENGVTHGRVIWFSLRRNLTSTYKLLVRELKLLRHADGNAVVQNRIVRTRRPSVPPLGADTECR